MTEIGRLVDVMPREAWPNEAATFTPWLAQNLDRLAEAIGIPMELEGQEVLVGTFYADILARNPADGGLILIENQLERSDHSHLGQIMTYLAGLNASTVVWIAREFREPHLSAIRWLNEHTAEPFAFFAIQLRVVRIGDSLPAPVFDILARPNGWERRLQANVQEQGEVSELAQFRREFWAGYRERFPEDAKYGAPLGGSNWWWELPELNLILSIYVSKKSVGMFLRGPAGVTAEETFQLVEPLAPLVSSRFGASLRQVDSTYQLELKRQLDMQSRDNWADAVTWLHDNAHAYHDVLDRAFTTRG